MAKRLIKRWGFGREAARTAAEFAVEPARLRFSLKAIRRMLPFLESGKSVQEAKNDAYPEYAGADHPWDLLPPLKPDRIWREHCSDGRKYDGIEVKNPAVERSLSEVRKIVNAVIRRWGKPDEIRIELARDLKKPRKEREAESGLMREQEAWRNAALPLPRPGGKWLPGSRAPAPREPDRFPGPGSPQRARLNPCWMTARRCRRQRWWLAGSPNTASSGG